MEKEGSDYNDNENDNKNADDYNDDYNVFGWRK